MYTKVYEVRNTVFSEKTGQLPTRSQRGNKYLMVMVEIDSNAIMVEPLKIRKDPELARAYRAMMLRLKRAGIVPRKHILYNEVSEAMRDIIRDEYNMEMEIVPPRCHQRNAAKVAIRNFKAHFLSVLAGTADDFPPSLWDRLLTQVEITVNLLRQSNATPKVSAYAHLCGPFDYNKMPLAPIGCAVQVHEKTDKRGTWAYHSIDGWYLATSPEHYCTHLCHIKQTRSERLTNTTQFTNKNITRPTITHADKVMEAIAECIKAIKGIRSSNGKAEMQQLRRLAEKVVCKDPAVAAQLMEKPTKSATWEQGKEESQNCRQTRSMGTITQQATRVPMRASPRVENPAAGRAEAPMSARTAKKRRKRRAAVRLATAADATARNMRAQKKASGRACHEQNQKTNQITDAVGAPHAAHCVVNKHDTQ